MRKRPVRWLIGVSSDGGIARGAPTTVEAEHATARRTYAGRAVSDLGDAPFLL